MDKKTNPHVLSTYYAPAGRATERQLNLECRIVEEDRLTRVLINAMPDPAVILNSRRQIVAANARLLHVFGLHTAAGLIGRRPGEAFNCTHHEEGPDGCGTAPSCSVCGAVVTILACMDTKQQKRGECRLLVGKEGKTALTLEVVVTPLKLGRRQYYVCAIKDIAAEKWKQIAERVFFHDILNAAGGIRGIAAFLAETHDVTAETEQEYKKLMLHLSDSLIDDIKHQRHLLAAEKGEYVPRMERIDLAEMLVELSESMVLSEKAIGRHIRQEFPSTCSLVTDPPILRRIVGNMLINALEATSRGESVVVRSRSADGKVSIEVENPGEIPADIQLQIFKRSFSTKAASGRGIGTYSIKLFGERYLGGEVGFTCGNGRTRFFITVPHSCETRDSATGGGNIGFPNDKLEGDD